MPSQPQHPETPDTTTLSSIARVLTGHLRDRVARVDEFAEIHMLTQPHVPPPRKKNQEKRRDMLIWDSMRISFLMGHSDIVFAGGKSEEMADVYEVPGGDCMGGDESSFFYCERKEREFYVDIFLGMRVLCK